MSDKLSRRGFIQDSLLAATALSSGVARSATPTPTPKPASGSSAPSVAPMAAGAPPRTIHPYPNDITWGRGTVNFQRQATLSAAPALDAATLEMMKETWRRFTLDAVELTVRADKSLADGQFALTPGAQSPSRPPALKPPATYALTVDAAGAAASAASPAGVRHAWFTLLQMLEAGDESEGALAFAVPHASIQDWPALKFRGLHLCVFPETTPLMLEKAIRLAGLFKFTHAVIEFWGMLRLDTLKELSWPEAWSKPQARRLLDIARAMGLEVIPMFNSWGHATASRLQCGRHVVLDQNPRLAPLFEPDGWTWCLSNPRTRALLHDIHSELIEFAGPGEYFHIGCDEAYSHATCDRCRRSDPVRLFAGHIAELDTRLERLGRRTIMWGDTLLEQGKWPAGIVANSSPALPTHLALDRLSRRIVIADWHYDLLRGEVPTLAHFQQRGFTTLACPWNSRANIQTLARGAARNESLGLLATTWHHLADCMPQLAFTANAAWSRDGGALKLRQCSPTHLNLATATLLRKLVPAQGHFDRAGWFPYEMKERIG